MSKRDRRRKIRQQQDEEASDVTLQDVDAAGYGDIHRQLEAVGGDKLRIHKDGTMEYAGFQMSRIGITQYGDDLDRFVSLLRELDTSIQWWIGDLLVYAEREYGRTYEDFAEAYGFRVNSLYQYKYVAEKVEFSIRIENLSFAHHQLVAAMEPDLQETFLQDAAHHNWTVKELREAINTWKGIQSRSDEVAPSIVALQRLKQQFDQTQWRSLSQAERKEIYDTLRDIMEQMENWGIE